MEPDRYQNNNKLFIVGIISLMLSLIMLAMSLYLLPHILFGWRYDTPELIIHANEWLQVKYVWDEITASGVIFSVFFIGGLILAVVAYLASNKIDNEILKIERKEGSEPAPRTDRNKEAMTLTTTLVIIIIGIFLVGALIEWLIHTPPPTQELQMNNIVERPNPI